MQITTEKAMATQYSCLENPMGGEGNGNSSTLAWKIPWAEEPGRLQSMGLLRVGNDQTTSL